MFKILLLLLCGHMAFALSPLDKALSKLITKHKLTSLPKSELQNQDEVILGSRLFREARLSGNKDITCMHCHHPMLGTSDDLPFSIGTGGAGLGRGRSQAGKGHIIRRSSPPLINLGYSDIKDMFWDGRVHVDHNKGEFHTPSKELNNNAKVNKMIRSSLAAQVIFPLLSTEEMLGTDNEIANAKGDFGKWNALIDRLLNGRRSALYQSLFKRAYPKDFEAGKINISHVANALAAFITKQFNLVDTPYDEYLNGDMNALNETQKRGLKIFLDKGACINCHGGQHLTNWDYKSIAIPEIGPEDKASHLNDKGRFEVTGKKEDQYSFRTPPLRNINFSAPYMHNGAFATLEEVVDHYNHLGRAIRHYIVPETIQSIYEEKIVKDESLINNKLRYQLISNDDISHRLHLTEDEKLDLVEFLRTGLSSRRLQRLQESPEIIK